MASKLETVFFLQLFTQASETHHATVAEVPSYVLLICFPNGNPFKAEIWDSFFCLKIIFLTHLELTMKLKLLNIPYTRRFIIISWPTLGFISVFFLHNELLAPCKIVYPFFWAFISGTFFWNSLPLFFLWIDNSVGLLGSLSFPATGCPLYSHSTLCKKYAQ